MKVDKSVTAIIKERAKENNESINKDNFVFYSCEHVVDEFINNLIDMECNVEDVMIILKIFEEKALRLPIKKEEEKLPSF